MSHVKYARCGDFGRACKEDPEAGRRLLENELRKDGGVLRFTAMRLGLPRRSLEILIVDLGLRGLPAQIREELAKRYRLPPLGAA